MREPKAPRLSHKWQRRQEGSGLPLALKPKSHSLLPQVAEASRRERVFSDTPGDLRRRESAVPNSILEKYDS